MSSLIIYFKPLYNKSSSKYAISGWNLLTLCLSGEGNQKCPGPYPSILSKNRIFCLFVFKFHLPCVKPQVIWLQEQESCGVQNRATHPPHLNPRFPTSRDIHFAWLLLQPNPPILTEVCANRSSRLLGEMLPSGLFLP